MKHSLALLCPALLLLASCGSSAYLSQQTFQDGIYYKPYTETVKVLSQEDFQKLAAENIARELEQEKPDSLKEFCLEGNNITINVIDPWYYGHYYPWGFGMSWYNSAWYWNRWHWSDWYWGSPFWYDPYFYDPFRFDPFWYPYGYWGNPWYHGYWVFGYYGHSYYPGYHHGFYPGHHHGHWNDRTVIRANRNSYNASSYTGYSRAGGPSRSIAVSGSGLSGSGRNTVSGSRSGSRIVIGSGSANGASGSRPAVRASGSTYRAPSSSSSTTTRSYGNFQSGSSRSSSSSYGGGGSYGGGSSRSGGGYSSGSHSGGRR